MGPAVKTFSTPDLCTIYTDGYLTLDNQFDLEALLPMDFIELPGSGFYFL